MPVILVNRGGRFVPVDSATGQVATSRPADVASFRNALAMGPIRGPRGEFFAPSSDVMGAGPRAAMDRRADAYHAMDGSPPIGQVYAGNPDAGMYDPNAASMPGDMLAGGSGVDALAGGSGSDTLATGISAKTPQQQAADAYLARATKPTSMAGDWGSNLMNFGLAAMAAGGRPGATLASAVGQGGLQAMQLADQQDTRRLQGALTAETLADKATARAKAENQQRYQEAMAANPPPGIDPMRFKLALAGLKVGDFLPGMEATPYYMTRQADGTMVGNQGAMQAAGNLEAFKEYAKTPALLDRQGGEWRLKMQFQPQLEASTEAAKNPALIARAAGTASVQQAAEAAWAGRISEMRARGVQNAENAPAAGLPGAIPGETMAGYKARNLAMGTDIGKTDAELRQVQTPQGAMPAAAAVEAARNPALVSRAVATHAGNAETDLGNAEQKAAAEARGKASVKPEGFQGTGMDAQAMNVVRSAQAKIAAGQPLTPAEQYDFALAQRHLTEPKVVGTPETGFTAVTPPPLPAYPGAAAPAGAPAGLPAPALPTVTDLVGGKGKDIPAPINTAMTENINAVRKIDQALGALQIDPAATGVKGLAPDSLLNRVDPKGTEARALVADIGSLKIHDRSGAAVSVSEFPRLKPFVPEKTDDYDTVVKKLGLFRREYASILNDMAQIYSPGQGYKENPAVRDFLRGQTGTIPAGAADALKADPSLRDQFDAKYGAGSAARVLGR